MMEMQRGAGLRKLPVVLLLAALLIACPGVLPFIAGAQEPTTGETLAPDSNVTLQETRTVTPEMTVTGTPVAPPGESFNDISPVGMDLLAAPAPGIDVSVNPATVSFGGARMAVPGYHQANVTVTVQASGVKDWFLRAEDTTPGNPSKGFLYSFSPARNLSSSLMIWDFTLIPPGFRPLGTGNDVFYVSDKGGKTTVDALFMQEATTMDRSGTYTLIVTFTATTS
jgi:hypothetical protein